MKTEYNWDNNGHGTNESGFSGPPGGQRGAKGTFADIGSYGLWWSLTESDTASDWFRYLFYQSDFVGRSRVGENKTNGRSVRCLRDKII
jgi:uncharacterized protein (TIGR02145 family)